jgi:hypothetical protein
MRNPLIPVKKTGRPRHGGLPVFWWERGPVHNSSVPAFDWLQNPSSPQIWFHANLYEILLFFATIRMVSPLSDKNIRTCGIEEFPHTKSNEKQIRKGFQKVLAPIYILCYYTFCIPHMEFKERI